MKTTTLFTLLLFCLNYTFAQTAAQKQQLIRKSNANELVRIEKKLDQKYSDLRTEALDYAAKNNIPITYSIGSQGFAELQKIENGIPIYYVLDNVDAAISTRTNHLNIGGSLGLNLDGQSMTVGVWDGGAIQTSHQEFDGPGGNNRASINDGETTMNGNSFHMQHVTGTIIAHGANPAAKGMAPRAAAMTYTWNNDLTEMANAAANGLLVSNHSYGFGWRNQSGQVQLPAYYGGGYISNSRDLDQVLYNAPYYLMVNSAGNDGNDNTANSSPLQGNSQFDKLTGFSTAKNNLVVANAQDVSVDANGNITGTVLINNSSSEGPTDDLRIKPDITGNGTDVYSAINFEYSPNYPEYANLTGTSMSSPNVAGSMLLLQQHYNNVNGTFMRAATAKGLALHTADDAGISGPDAVFGWGLLNTKKAAEVISDNGVSSIIDERTLANGGSYQVTVNATGTEPLYASISWTDPAGTANTGIVNLSTPVLVNDLDVRVTKGGTTSLPYALTGVNSNAKTDNTVDPFERVDIGTASGSYTITVTHKGTLTGGSQAFSLIITGASSGQGCTLAAPSNLSAISVSENSFALSWNAVAGATSYTVSVNGSASTVSGTSYSTSGLSLNTSYSVSVVANCITGSGSPATISVTTSGSASLSCSGTVTSFPYSQGFESGEGWTQVGGDDGDWYRTNSGTPSSNTGPGSAVQGAYYLFLEASTNNSPGQIGNNATAILESPCFDLTGVSDAAFSFQHHMYGNAVGSLSVEATLDGQNWVSLWSQSDNQGNQWNTEDLSLDSYAEEIVKLRFVGTTGNGWSSDIAIDDLSIQTGSGTDTQAPSAPTGLAVSNIAETSLTISWNASSDNVGVSQYNVFLDGSNLGSVSGTAANITGLVEATTYTIGIQAQDAAGNTSAISTTSGTTIGGGCTTVTVNSNNFESGWGIWNDGGSDARRSSSDAPYSNGTYSIRLRDNSSTSTMATDNLDLSSFEEISVSFSYLARSMDNANEDFWLQVSTDGGASYATVEEWNRDDEFVNNVRESDVVTITGTFSATTRLRFRCDASGNSDWVYIDDVVITGCSNSSNAQFMVTSEEFVQDSETVLERVAVVVYPNPVSDQLTIEGAPETATVRLMTLSGRIIKQGIGIEEFEMSGLRDGLYLVQIVDKDLQKTIKVYKR
ncbi:MAG: S8 family serine peptidase [Bacteroidota bacterium]